MPSRIAVVDLNLIITIPEPPLPAEPPVINPPPPPPEPVPFNPAVPAVVPFPPFHPILEPPIPLQFVP